MTIQDVLNKGKSFLFRLIVVAIPLLMSSCHYVYTGPMLWNHGSSWAAEFGVSLWVANLCILVWALIVAFEKRSK